MLGCKDQASHQKGLPKNTQTGPLKPSCFFPGILYGLCVFPLEGLTRSMVA